MNDPDPTWESGLRVTISNDEGDLFAVRQSVNQADGAAA